MVNQVKTSTTNRGQMSFFPTMPSSLEEIEVQPEVLKNPPTTRYQGSKLKLLSWIWDNIAHLQFNTVLEAFGGTGCMSYMFKARGKEVTFNDYLRFNQIMAKALIENNDVRLDPEDIEFVLRRDQSVNYDNLIERTFEEIFFTSQENAQLDVVAQNIARLQDEYKRALAYYALFQTCIIKRPYNLFHRANLYIRTAEVKRSFGNKVTWDTPFEQHFRTFIAEANDAVFASKRRCRALCSDALEVEGNYDLVYIDTPYITKNKVGVNYLDFYHFLEGMTDYPNWERRIDHTKKHRPLKGAKSAWSDPKRTFAAFEKLFDKYKDSILVISYRSDGIPSEEELVNLLRTYKSDVQQIHYGQYKYVLSTNTESKEILLIAR